MGAWPNQEAALGDFRIFLNDGPTDHPVKGKGLVGRVDGTNRDFVTWDDRLIDGTVKVVVNGAFVDPDKVEVVDPVAGELRLQTAPPPTAVVRGMYYFNFFLDLELRQALELAAGEINENNDVTSVAPGMKTAALYFGASFAYEKQSIRWMQRLSNRFRVEDEPVDADATERPKLFADWSQKFMDKAILYRDNYYQRHGRRNVPQVARINPFIPPAFPRR